MNYFWATFFILIAPFYVLSQNYRLDNTEKIYAFDPGTVTSIAVTLHNLSKENAIYDISYSSNNKQIQLFNPNQTISVIANQKSIIIIPIKIDQDCLAGRDTLAIKVLNKNDTGQQNYQLYVLINQIRKISILAIKDNDIIRSGDTIYTDFRIKNLGNTIQEVKLNSNSGKISGAKTFKINPLEEKNIIVSKPTSSKEHSISNQLIDLRIIEPTINEQMLVAYTNVEIIHTKPIELDAFKRLPVQASLAYIHSNQYGIKNAGWQGEINSSGNLSEKYNDYLSLRIATKNPIPYNAFTAYEEYFANYMNDKLMIHIGDKAYSSSILTENFRYGRGLGLFYNFGKISISGFYNKPRFYNNIKDEFNLSADININRSDKITLGYLQKRPLTDSTFSTDQIISTTHLPYLIYTSKQIKNTILEVEYAYSTSNDNNGSAIRLLGNTKIYKFNGTLNFIYSSPSFRGYYQNSTNLNASINYSISSNSNLYFNLYQDAKKFERDTLQLAAPLRKHANLAFNQRYSRKGTISFLAGYLFNEDRLYSSLFKYQELFLQLNINQEFGNFRIDLNNQYGQTKNQILEITGKSLFNQISISYLVNRTSLNVFGNMSNNARYSQTNKRYFFYGANINTQLFDATNLNLYYQNNFNPEDYYRDRNQFEGIIVQTIKKNNFISFSSRYMLERGQIEQKNFIYSIKYTRNINLPLKRTANYSTLSGRIIDENNEALSNIRINLGSRFTLTDKNGYYNFFNLIPGKYYLDIDNSTLPLNAITDLSLPEAIDIQQENTNNRNIKIIKSGTLQGQVLLSNNIKFHNIIVDENNIKNSNLIIELSNEQQTLRKLVRINDKFEFNYLRPGIWKVKIHKNDLDNNIKITVDEYQVEIKSGVNNKNDIHLEYVQKEIHYQQNILKVGKINN